MRTLKDVRQAYKDATDILPTLTRDAAAFAAKEAEIAALEAELDVFEREARAADIRNRALAQASTPALVEANPELSRGFERFSDEVITPRGSKPDAVLAKRFAQIVGESRRSWGVQFDAQRHFRTLGEQLQAIATYYLRKDGTVDGRLQRAPTGASEIDPTGGGFLLQVDFASAIWMLAHEMGEILGAVNGIPIKAEANGIKIRGVDETSRATGSRWGGVQSYWVGEGTSVTPTKPKFRLIEFDLKKLMSVMYTTDELMQDASALSAIAGQAFSEEIMFMTEDSIVNGTGAGQPLGILNSPALIQVAKQPGQAAATIVKENVDNLWARMWARSRKNSVWYINQDAEPQLNQMGQIVGTGGIPIYIPAGGLSAAPYATLYGRPVISTEYSAALGAPGDILLADLSQYTKVDKGGVQAATSMHVAFLTDENVFRITYRVDGKGTLSAFSLIAGCVSGGLFGALFFWETLIRMALAFLSPGYANLWYGDIVTIGLMLWGVQAEVVPTVLVMRRRRMPGIAKVLLTLPASYILISLASWVALLELLVRPFHWGKTEHGREKAKLEREAAVRPVVTVEVEAG